MTARQPETWSAGAWIALAAAFLGAALVSYRPAFEGPFLSDDLHYVANNPWVHALSLERFLEIWDPAGPATVGVVNYTPVHVLGHALAWQAFGSDTTGHHVVNVVLHVLASLLLAALFLQVGLPSPAALFGGAFFLLHPANVEAVAWISQLKSVSALSLSLGALLLYPRRPAGGTALFLLALLAKPTAAYALPVAALLEWTRAGRVRWRWIGLWAAVFALYSVAEFTVHQRSGAAEATLHESPLVLARTIAGLALRYVVMGATSLGISAFHEPRPAFSWADSWWLASLPLLALLGGRLVVVLRRREPEAAFWVWALVSFGPVSQIFPFLYPLADRYLYFILPGLLGGALFAGREAWQRAPEAMARLGGEPARPRRLAAPTAVALAAVLLAVFAVRAHERAGLWRSAGLLVADAASHYPHGVSANVLRAKRAARLGDAEAAVASLRRAVERGYNRFEQLAGDPGFAPIRHHPAFRELLSDIAATWIEIGRSREDPTQLELWRLAEAHLVRGEEAAAARALRRALSVGGPADARIRAELARLERSAP